MSGMGDLQLDPQQIVWVADSCPFGPIGAAAAAAVGISYDPRTLLAFLVPGFQSRSDLFRQVQILRKMLTSRKYAHDVLEMLAVSD